MDHSALFRPFQARNFELPNRIVMAPMTRSFSPGGIPGANVAEYYEKRAADGVGLILTEGTLIERPAAGNEPDVPKFYGAEALAGWAEVVKRVHGAGGKIWPQLWHVGALRNPAVKWAPPTPLESPSGISRPGKPSGLAMTEADVADTINAFANAAASAQVLGFDGIELHGAHGYLIDQFFWAGSNERTDQWGGASIGQRTRFAAEVIRAVRAAVGPGFPIGIRLSQWKQQDFPARLASSPEELSQWLAPLVDAGADVLHCSQRRFWEPEFEGSALNFAGWAKKLTGLPAITVGSIGLSGEFVASYSGEASQPASLDDLVRRLDQEEFDLVAVGRAILADPHWVSKVRDARFNELGGFERQMLATLS
jgi:2,4-dienoyl-CoA reductase-like NADH-dependent reductase (Old Yellow Enzyme family)